MMNEVEHLLACLAEEAAEVNKNCMKALRFGLGDKEPGQYATNAERIHAELIEVVAVADMLTKRGVLRSIAGGAADLMAHKRKQLKVEHYLDYAREAGTVEPRL